MRRNLGGLIVAALLIASAGWAEESHVRARLACDLERLEPGVPFHLGVLLEPEPGWHIYWRNPGEAGLATEVLYDLPEGYEVGEVQWPVPVEFVQSGDIAGYGYEGEVLLAAEVGAPDHVESTIPAKLSASWLACKDTCVYGSTEISVRLPLEKSTLGEARTAFAGWTESLPIPAEPGRLSSTVTGGPVPKSGPADLSVWLNWSREPGTVEFFPDPGPGLKVEGVNTRTRGRLTRVDLRVSVLKGTTSAKSMFPAVVVTTDGTGNRRGVSIDINLE